MRTRDSSDTLPLHISKSSLHGLLDGIVVIELCLFSFCLSYKAGERGFFAFDQSIVFDGAYRILSGQVPYEDFVIPFGPVVFWMQALFFKLLGINYSSYILHAAVINALAVLISIYVLRLLFPGKRLPSYLGGLLTGVWFYSPIGTPWMEQTAFFFCFAATAMVLTGCQRRFKDVAPTRFILILAGVLAFISVMSKQNAGLLYLPLCYLIMFAVCAPDWKRIFLNSLVFSAGFIMAMLVFILWLFMRSNVTNFVEHFFVIPASLGQLRLFGDCSELLKTLATGAGPAPMRIILLALTLPAVLFMLKSMRRFREEDHWRRPFVASIMCVYFVFSQHLFIHITLNKPELGYAFLGITFGCAVGLLFEAFSAHASRTPESGSADNPLFRKMAMIATMIAICCAVFYASKTGIVFSLKRDVHPIFKESEYPEYISQEKLKGLRWARPNRIAKIDLTEAHIAAFVDYLREKDKNFFIFPDYTIFYAMLDVPSPQPVLWFHRGLTYPSTYNPDLDRWIVDDLKRNKVQIIILEKEGLFSPTRRLSHFPHLSDYINRCFHQKRTIGIFAIYEDTET
jgi:hypothetical protein